MFLRVSWRASSQYLMRHFAAITVVVVCNEEEKALRKTVHLRTKCPLKCFFFFGCGIYWDKRFWQEKMSHLQRHPAWVHVPSLGRKETSLSCVCGTIFLFQISDLNFFCFAAKPFWKFKFFMVKKKILLWIIDKWLLAQIQGLDIVQPHSVLLHFFFIFVVSTRKAVTYSKSIQVT